MFLRYSTSNSFSIFPTILKRPGLIFFMINQFLKSPILSPFPTVPSCLQQYLWSRCVLGRTEEHIKKYQTRPVLQKQSNRDIDTWTHITIRSSTDLRATSDTGNSKQRVGPLASQNTIFFTLFSSPLSLLIHLTGWGLVTLPTGHALTLSNFSPICLLS